MFVANVTNVSHLLSHPGTLLTPFRPHLETFFRIFTQTIQHEIGKKKNHDYPQIISTLPLIVIDFFVS